MTSEQLERLIEQRVQEAVKLEQKKIQKLESELYRLKKSRDKAQRETVKARVDANDRIQKALKETEETIFRNKGHEHHVLLTQVEQTKDELSELRRQKSSLEHNQRALAKTRELITDVMGEVHELTVWDYGIPDECIPQWQAIATHMAQTATLLMQFVGGNASQEQIENFLVEHDYGN